MKIPKIATALSVLMIIPMITMALIGPTLALENRWYIKPEYPDYAPSGMPDFDERQDQWYPKVRVPDALAVWQHWNQTTLDWEIFYSLYNDPNIWWTLGGVGTARPLIIDTPIPGPGFLPGDDQQPAVSWYSNNYAIAVWQHYNPYYADWDIWYSVFTPGVGWTTPTFVSQQMGEDLDPAIAFDTNGYAVCVWRHRVDPTPPPVAIGWKIAYSVWSPLTLTWTAINLITPPIVQPTNAMMPEVCLDSQHNAVVIWTDNPAFPPPAGQEQVYYSYVLLPAVSPPPVPLPWSVPAVIPGCPLGINWQKGISPDNLGNNLIDFGYPAPFGQPVAEPLYYGQFTSPSKTWSVPATTLTIPTTDGEHPDLAFDLNNNAIAVYTKFSQATPPAGQIWFSYWNGLNWAPVGGAFAATAATGTFDQWPALAFISNNKAVMVWQSSLNTTPLGAIQQSYDDDIFYSVYTPPYPPGAWSPAATVVPAGVNNPNGGSIPSLTGNDWYADVASPTGSATTPPSVPPALPPPAVLDWSYCGPTAVANSVWWFDSKYEPNNSPPPTLSDGFSLVKSYNPGVWDDHDPNNVQPLIEHLAWLMDTDGQRTGCLSSGTYTIRMQIGITQYLSWSGANPLGDANGDGVVNQTDVGIVNAAMGSRPGAANWNMAADIWPETVTGPKTADNMVDINDLNLVNNNMGKKGMFYEHTEDAFCREDFFYYIESEVEKCQDVVLLIGIYRGVERIYGHFITVAGVNSTTHELLISNPIRDDFEAGVTPGRSPVAHAHLSPEPPYTTHNNASLVSQDAWHCTLDPVSTNYHWIIDGYESDPSLTTRIEAAVITSPYEDVYDVALTDIWSCYGSTILAAGLTYKVNITITNQGTTPVTCTLQLYWNETNLIGQTSVSLLISETKNVTIMWNTAGYTEYNVYKLRGYAIPLPGETDTVDNDYYDVRWIRMTHIGDINYDKKVDIKDIAAIAKLFGINWPDPKYDPDKDIDNNGKIDIKDVAAAAKNFGWHA